MAAPSSMEPVPSAQGQGASQQRLAESWVRLMKQVTSSKDYQDIAGLVAKSDVLFLQNERLERALQDAHTAETLNLDAIRRVKNENDAMKEEFLQKVSELKMAQTKESEALGQLQQAQRQLQNLEKQLKVNASKISETMKSKLDTDARIRNLQEEKEKVEDGLKQSEANLKRFTQANMEQSKKLGSTIKELNDLKALTMPLTARTDRQIHLKQLSVIFEEAYHLIDYFYGQLDLSDYVFSSDLWKRLADLKHLNGIPLPPTNSGAAKHMRVAAVLRLLAEAMCSHIFQPIYISHRGTTTADMLDAVEQIDPKRATHVRSVLLNIDPAKQDDYAKKRVHASFKDVFDVVRFLLGDDKPFGRALLAWLDKVCSTWRSLQQSEVRYEALFEGNNEDLVPEEWEPLPQPLVRPMHTQAVNGAASDGTHGKPNPNLKLELANVAAQIWPTFLCVTTAGKLETVKTGYVLLKAQTAAAGQELSSQARPRTKLDSQRMGRGMRLGVIPTNGANESRERLDSFLG